MKKLEIKPKYKKILIISISILLMVLCSVFIYKDLNKKEIITYHVGILETDTDEKLVLVNDFERYLDSDTILFEYSYYPSIFRLVEAIHLGIVDITFMDAYSLSKNELPMTLSIIASKNIALESEKPQNYYRSILLMKEDLNEDELVKRNVKYEDLTYCVMNPTSIAGYIGVMPFFEENGINYLDVRSIKVNDFEDSLINLASSTCDVGVGYTNIREEYDDMWEFYNGSLASIYDELSIIYVSDKLYDDAVIVSDKVDIKLRKQLLEFLYNNGYSESNNEDYEYLRNIINKYLGGY